jgi:diguanylate cyclase (GGDEF)-like protein
MKKLQINLLLLIFVIISMTGIYIFFISESNESISCYNAQNGIISFEKLDWSKNKVIELNGEWQYYDSLLKDDLDLKTSSIIKTVPDYWEEDQDMKFSPYHFGTYKLKVEGLKQNGVYALEMPDQVTAYALFANNEKVASNGIVGKDKSTSVPQWKPMTSVFKTDSKGEVEFLMEVSNFDYYRGGFWNSIKIGNTSDIFDYNNKNIIREMFLFVAIFIVGLVSLGLFFIYKREKVTLYFGLFCFSMSSTILLTGQRLISNMISIFDWYTLVRLEYLAGYLLVPIFGLFAIELFEFKIYEDIIKRFLKLSIVFFFVVTLFATNHIFSAIMKPYKYGAIIFSFYIIYLIFKSIRNGQSGAKLILFGAFCMIVSLIQETFIGGPVSWVPFASLNFVICFLIITFKQFLEVIRRNDVLEMEVVLDPLTGLYNRSYLAKLNTDYLENKQNENIYVIFLDLDRFKHINDTFGHKIGDLILKKTARRLKNIIGNKGTICRYGGDEIIIIINNISKDEIIKIAKRIITSITKPIEMDNSSYEIGVSIGIAESEFNTRNIKTVIRRSDEAMYKAKKNGGNQYCFME